MWEMIQLYEPVLILGLGSIWDIRKKRVPVVFLLISVIVAILIGIGNPEISWKDEWYRYFIGALIGIVLFAVSCFGGEFIGAADGIMIGIIGGTLGYSLALLFLSNAIMLAAVFSLIGLVAGKIKRNSTLPFFPFMLGGYLIMILFQIYRG